MSWSFSFRGKASEVLQKIDEQITKEIRYAEEYWKKEAHIIRDHLHAFRQFLSVKLSNLGSSSLVSVEAWGHKSEGEVHQMEMRIRPHVEEVIQKVEETGEKLKEGAEAVVTGHVAGEDSGEQPTIAPAADQLPADQLPADQPIPTLAPEVQSAPQSDTAER